MNVVIVGLGIIGGSYAKGLLKKGYNVYGVDKDLSTIEYAIENGIILAGSDKIIPFSIAYSIVLKSLSTPYTLYPFFSSPLA